MARRLSVSQLNNYIKNVFLDEMLLHSIEVHGEITEYNISGGNAYMTIKEGGCNLSCVRFNCNDLFPVGTNVLVFGSVTFYDKSGKVSFQVKDIKPFGEGEYYLRLQLIKERLNKDGLIGTAKPLPMVINSVALITSSTGAVIQDFLRVLSGRNAPNVYVFNVKVQGENADGEIIEALNDINKHSQKFDCAVIARGGGANFDLETFNSEPLARAAAISRVPVISAVGHETDYTILDLCTSQRAATPSIAAEIIMSIRENALSGVIDMRAKINSAVERLFAKYGSSLKRLENVISETALLKLNTSKGRLNVLAERLNSKAAEMLQNKKTRLFDSSAKLDRNVSALLDKTEKNYTLTEKDLERLSPLKILKSGYAKIEKNKRAVSGINELTAGDEVKVFLSGGSFDSVVKNVKGEKEG